MSFESFVDMIQRKALVFLPLEVLDDPYEGFIFKAIKTKLGKDKILSILKKLAPELAIPNYAVLSRFEKTIHEQSWTKCAESDALWRIYSHGKTSIRIEVSTNSIKKLNGVHLHEINYYESTLDSEIEKLISEDRKSINIAYAFLYKRTAFEHEKEVRLLTDIDLNYIEQNGTSKEKPLLADALNALLKKGEITQEEYNTGINNINREEKFPNVKFIPFDHIENFICSVMLNPLAQVWFEDTLKKFCENNGLNYIGKSNLYKFNFELHH